MNWTKKCRRYGGHSFQDGIVDYDKHINSKPRILWILKEVYKNSDALKNKSENWRDVMKNISHPTTYGNVMSVSCGIFWDYEKYDKNLKPCREKWDIYVGDDVSVVLDEIAVIIISIKQAAATTRPPRSNGTRI